MAGEKVNSRVMGCLLKLVGFVVMVMVFIAIIFFLFNGLTYVMSGENLDIPGFDGIVEAIDQFTQGVATEMDNLMTNTDQTEIDNILEQSDDMLADVEQMLEDGEANAAESAPTQEAPPAEEVPPTE